MACSACHLVASTDGSQEKREHRGELSVEFVQLAKTPPARPIESYRPADRQLLGLLKHGPRRRLRLIRRTAVFPQDPLSGGRLLPGLAPGEG